VTTLVLREATAADVELLYAWRNEPAARLHSFNQGEVIFSEHEQWLARRLAARERTRIWILVDGADPVGQIRYDMSEGGVADISFSIDAQHRGRRLGVEILRLSASRACRELGAVALRGLVKLSNIPSLRAFERAGFRRMDDAEEHGGKAAVFVWSCGG
jgi:UDP-2,4-diacetamido-2,4,6-trideoxy-beta-L-altropyranose hydrolase